jgi:DeoR family transcriptional regulator, fructose operon transcriptional repressor
MSVKSEENKNGILKILNRNNSITIQELEELLKVSGATIRHYLTELQAEGFLYRVHGGAVVKEKLKYELPFQERLEKDLPEKKAIARKALSLIGEKEAVFLDSGSTVLELARVMKEVELKNIVVVTISIPILAELAGAPGIKLIGIGGEVTRNHCAFCGSVATNMLRQFHFDKVVLGTDGLSIENGLTTEDFAVAEVEKVAIEQSKQRIVLADHSKIGSVSFASSIGTLKDIDLVITDWGVSKEHLEAFQRENINLVVAEK